MPPRRIYGDGDMRDTRACSYCGSGGLEIIQACSRCGNPYCIRHRTPHAHNCRHFNVNRFSTHIPGVYRSGMKNLVAVYTTGDKNNGAKAKPGGLAAWLARLLGKSRGKKGARGKMGKKRTAGKPGRKKVSVKKRNKK